MPPRAPPPLALPPCLPTELLTYILAQTTKTNPTHLLICSTRATFLSTLLSTLTIPTPGAPHSPPPATPALAPLLSSDRDGDQDQDGDKHPDPDSDQDKHQEQDQADPAPPSPETTQTKHHLLVPTLLQISTSRHVQLAFLPTVSHLRAYVAVAPSQSPLRSGPGREDGEGEGDGPPLVVVYGLVKMHRDTSEWSAQGLGSTVAAVVEAGRAWRGRLVLVEEREVEELRPADAAGDAAEDEDEDADVDADANPDGGGDGDNAGAGAADGMDLGSEIGEEVERGAEVWKQRLPMLNGSMMRGGTAWSGRTVDVGTVLKRWFRFSTW